MTSAFGSDFPCIERDELFRIAYAEFLRIKAGEKMPTQLMPYGWLNAPTDFEISTKGGWQVYKFYELAQEGARELANSINRLTVNVRDISAWARVLSTKNRSEARLLRHEFLRDKANLTMLMPYTVKARFFFYCALISHQGNYFVSPESWEDTFKVLPDERAVVQQTAQKLAKEWKTWKPLIASLEKCDGAKYREVTKNFRSTYTHRFERQLDEGLSQPLTRRQIVRSDRAGYVIGGSDPIMLSEILVVLENECRHFAKAYSRFQDFVSEQKKSAI